MTRCVLMFLAAYALLAIESAFPVGFPLSTPHGCFIWMMLPWLATLPSHNSSITAAAAYGFMLEALTSHHPGVLITVTIVSVCVLRRIISPIMLETTPRIFVSSFVCGSLMAMLLAMYSILAGASPAPPIDLMFKTAISSAFSAMLATGTVALFRTIAKPFRPPQGAIQ